MKMEHIRIRSLGNGSNVSERSLAVWGSCPKTVQPTRCSTPIF